MSPQQRRRRCQERALGSPPHQTGLRGEVCLRRPLHRHHTSPWRRCDDLQSDHLQRLRHRPHDDCLPWHSLHPHDPFHLGSEKLRCSNLLGNILRASSSCSRARKSTALACGLCALVLPQVWKPLSPFSGCKVGEASNPGPSPSHSGIFVGSCPTFAPGSWSGSFVLPIFHHASGWDGRPCYPGLSHSGAAGPTVFLHPCVIHLGRQMRLVLGVLRQRMLGWKPHAHQRPLWRTRSIVLQLPP